MISTKCLSPLETPATAARYGVELNEGELVARVRAQDPVACRELVHRYSGRMSAVTRRFFGCEHDRDDALQDALLSAFRGIDRFTASSSLSTWLHRITVNACLMKRRRRSREVSIEALPEQASHRLDSASAGQSVQAELERSELREMVLFHVMLLPQHYRTVLWLRDIEQVDADEAARLIGCTTGALKVRLHRARRALLSTLIREKLPIADDEVTATMECAPMWRRETGVSARTLAPRKLRKRRTPAGHVLQTAANG